MTPGQARALVPSFDPFTYVAMRDCSQLLLPEIKDKP